MVPTDFITVIFVGQSKVSQGLRKCCDTGLIVWCLVRPLVLVALVPHRDGRYQLVELLLGPLLSGHALTAIALLLTPAATKGWVQVLRHSKSNLGALRRS